MAEENCIWDSVSFLYKCGLSKDLVTLPSINHNLSNDGFWLSSLFNHQAGGASWLQEGWRVHEVLPLLHVEKGQAWGSCSRCWACQVDRNKAHSVPLLHKASFQLAIKQPRQRAFYEQCTLTSFDYSTNTAKHASVTILMNLWIGLQCVTRTSVCLSVVVWMLSVDVFR